MKEEANKKEGRNEIREGRKQEGRNRGSEERKERRKIEEKIGHKEERRERSKLEEENQMVAPSVLRARPFASSLVLFLAPSFPWSIPPSLHPAPTSLQQTWIMQFRMRRSISRNRGPSLRSSTHPTPRWSADDPGHSPVLWAIVQCNWRQLVAATWTPFTSAIERKTATSADDACVTELHQFPNIASK